MREVVRSRLARVRRSSTSVPADCRGRERSTYLASVMVLAASEDKLPRRLRREPDDAVDLGLDKIEKPSGAYHLVWSRDLYEIATALIAAGERPGPTAP